jgi:uncharacterized lipoprotein YmbA
MNECRRGWTRLVACGVSLAVALAGCIGTSRPSRFYTLAPLEAQETPVLDGTNPPLAIGPVEIADYLDRQEIVTRTGKNELVIAELDRWGGSLEHEITGSLVATIAERLAPRKMVVFPWKPVAMVPVTDAYRASISISRFDGVLGRSVVLHGRWELCVERGAREKSLLAKAATVSEKVDGSDYESLVAAMQRALVRFGEAVADSVAATDMAKAP